MLADHSTDGTLTNEFIHSSLDTIFASIPNAKADIKMYLLFKALISD